MFTITSSCEDVKKNIDILQSLHQNIDLKTMPWINHKIEMKRHRSEKENVISEALQTLFLVLRSSLCSINIEMS
ncbi:CLUMA_CG018414, isoform A [Clunio marinus]|uniref:CLUMA_CG018414, isoform A n=1 Tax=Clunio marinus TaxID=568069 RepID=A0A1J1IZH8_9DIPT|nr:CLUMA_CG018414, isoform A [Clunio marinus]